MAKGWLKNPPVQAAVVSGIAILLAAIFGPAVINRPDPCKSVHFSHKQTTEFMVKLINASNKIRMFDSNGIYQANELVEEVLNVECLESVNKIIAAKAHRIKASIYFAAYSIAGPTLNKVDEAVKQLGQGSWQKAAHELRKSLQLDPDQSEAVELTEYAKILEGSNSMPVDQFEKCAALLISKKYNGLLGTSIIKLRENIEKEGLTLLMAASGLGSLSEVKKHLQNGANPNEKAKSGFTAIMFAAMLGHDDIVKILLDNGADVNAKDNDGRTALFFAKQNGHDNVAKIIERFAIDE